jgi:hypothetical protein
MPDGTYKNTDDFENTAFNAEYRWNMSRTIAVQNNACAAAE